MGVFNRLWRFATGPFTTAPANGQAGRKKKLAVLTEEVAAYQPGVQAGNAGLLGQNSSTPDLGRMFEDVEAMLAHPRVYHSLNYYKAGIAGATFTVEDASSPEAAKFCVSELGRFWREHRSAVQRSYDYGRGSGELIYTTDDGALRLERLQPFMPLDGRVLTSGGHFAGVRVGGAGRRRDLWGPHGMVPSKGWWHAHDPRYSRWYGWPQLYSAWRPWRRLAGHDGAEDIVDGGVYRFAFAPPVGRFPAEDVTPPEPGGVIYTNRDKMRQMLESLKSGGVVALSSRTSPDGKYVWDVQYPTGALDVGGLIAYTDNLERAISLGVGVPPELIEASEVGSGYSGRAIPLEAFYVMQQANAEMLALTWYRLVGLPLLLWNFGPGSWCRLRVNDLLKERMKATQAEGPQEGPGAGPEQPGPGGPPPGGGGAEMGRPQPQPRPSPARFATDAVPEDDEEPDFEAIAELFYGLFGDEALDVLRKLAGGDATDDRSQIPAIGGQGGARFATWDAAAHPRGKGGQFIKKGSAEAVSTASDAVEKVFRGEKSDPKAILDHLSILTVKQIQALAGRYGKTVPRMLRADLIDAVRQIVEGNAGEAEKAQPAEAPKAPAAAPVSHGLEGGSSEDRALMVRTVLDDAATRPDDGTSPVDVSAAQKLRTLFHPPRGVTPKLDDWLEQYHKLGTKNYARPEDHALVNDAFAEALARFPDAEVERAVRSGAVASYEPPPGKVKGGTYPAFLDSALPGYAKFLRERLGARPAGGT